MHNSEMMERVNVAIGDCGLSQEDAELLAYYISPNSRDAICRAAITATLEALAEDFERRQKAFDETYPGGNGYSWPKDGDPLVTEQASTYGETWAEHFGGWFAETLRTIAAEITPAAAGTSDATEAGT